MTRVLVADDQALMRAGFGALVVAAPGLELAGEASTGAEAVRAALRLRPDVVLMDIRMPDGDGVAATEEILAAQLAPAPKVLCVTTFDLDEHVYAALRAGAPGSCSRTSGRNS